MAAFARKFRSQLIGFARPRGKFMREALSAARQIRRAARRALFPLRSVI
jgi:hypothetical protein